MPALDASYDGIWLPGVSPATDEMNTIDDPSPITGKAAWETRKCERRLTANV